MSTELIYEIIGYVASVLIAISLTMRSILRLRVINLIGSMFFTIYGLLIQAYPVAVVNFFIVLIDLYYLMQMRAEKEFFRLLEVEPDSEYLRYFLETTAEDIARFQPGFRAESGEGQRAFFILRNLVPAGVLIGSQRGDSLHVTLDYALPNYRDLKTGRFVYQHNTKSLLERGIHRVYTEPGTEAHTRYLRAMGFAPETAPDGSALYCLHLTRSV